MARISKSISSQWWEVAALLLSILLASMNGDSCCFVLGGSANYGAGKPWGIQSSHRSSTVYHRRKHESTSSPTGLLFPGILPNGAPKHNILQHERQQQNFAFRDLPRGGYADSVPSNYPTPPHSFVKIIGTITQLLISAGKTVLPALVAVTRSILSVYRALPMEAIAAQIGLVYCFLGGYYPTLFSSLQAAKYCGWHIMVKAIAELTEEATLVIDELEDAGVWDNPDRHHHQQNPRDVFLKQTHIVLTTVDPVKINTAAGALYTTWLGISTILRREYARVINLSLTLAEGIEGMARIVVMPALKLVIPTDYHRWVPVLLGWSAKAAAMRVAWRIERVLTAATSAIAGGAIVARSLTKLVERHRLRKQNRKRNHPKKGRSGVVAKNITTTTNGINILLDDEPDLSVREQVVGFAIGGLGFYTQMETQYKQRFSFVVPFPMNLVTWPFDLAERWIQWYITEQPQ